MSTLHESLLHLLLPGLGFFGSTEETALEVSVENTINEIELAIEAPNPELLNLSKIVLLNADGEELNRGVCLASINFSTAYGDSSQEFLREAFINGKMLHTRTEERPSVKVSLLEPIYISKIKIYNRADIYGGRSRFLTVKTMRDGVLASSFANLPIESARLKLDSILELVGLDEPHIENNQSLTEFKVLFRDRIEKLIERNALGFGLGELVHLLPVFDSNPSISNYHIVICAEYALLKWVQESHLRTNSLGPLSGILKSDYSIEVLKKEMEKLSAIRKDSTPNIVISRHHIHESNLLSYKNKYLKAMCVVVEIFANEGIVAMLGYGTLLGAVRDNGFMAHDDDVDLITFDGSQSKEQALMGKRRLVEILTSHGHFANDHGFWHLHAVVNGMNIDLFPGWVEGDEFQLPMQQLKIRPIPKSIILPPRNIDLYGHSYPAPADPAVFLENRYGAGWRIPDPYYEWSWPIERITSGLPMAVRSARDRRELISRRHLGRICRVASGQRVNRGDDSPPMNSLPIIKVAHETGYDAIELDIRFTLDDFPVLAHDDLLNGPLGKIEISKSKMADLEKFCLGFFDGVDVFIPSFKEALNESSGLDVQIDSRISPAQVEGLRKVVDEVGFDPTRLQFCVYNVAHAHALVSYFPESVLMWKTYRLFAEVDDFFLDEAQALAMDGIMVSVPRNYEDYSVFMNKLRDRGLRVLFFIHAGDEGKLKRMVSMGVDYVTTLANNTDTFKEIAGKK